MDNISVQLPTLNLYLLSQSVNNDYDTYDSVIVAALSEEDAKTIGPNNQPFPTPDWRWHDGWARTLDDIKAELIGTAIPGTIRGVILASFNAG